MCVCLEKLTIFNVIDSRYDGNSDACYNTGEKELKKENENFFDPRWVGRVLNVHWMAKCYRSGFFFC